MKKIITFLLTITSLFLTASCTTTEKATTEDKEIIVSAASSMTDVLLEIKTSFEKDNPGIKITYNLASSGKLSQQIEAGASVDVYIAASNNYMDDLEKKNLILTDTRKNIITNEIVLIGSKNKPHLITSFKELNNLKDKQLAIADPESSPIGMYSKEVLQHFNLWTGFENKLILAGTVRQVLTYVENDNVDYGIVFSTDAIISDKVKVLAKATPSWHTPIVYSGAVIKGSQHEEEANNYLTYVTSSKGKAIFNKFGFK
ncbi:molybdate ABC transporter substrate-binding protein [Tepidibacillus marianensis]|uniref:molybdate ABC transporter substrate-binding protein n=1 Tax=Tepidibacillus marianensis TaxID=3131995 RepID=UPI0030D22DC7